MSSNWVTSAISVGNRAFSNLFYVSFPNNAGTGNGNSLIPTEAHTNACAESITINESVTLDSEYSEAQKQHFFKEAKRPKTITINFLETADLSWFHNLRTWQESNYNEEGNYFLPGNHTGYIEIILGRPDAGGILTQQSMKIIAKEVIPSNVPYPKYSWKDGAPLVTSATFTVNKIMFEDSIAPARNIK